MPAACTPDLPCALLVTPVAVWSGVQITPWRAEGDGPMTKREAIKYVRKCDESEGPETYAEAAKIFEALYGRRPDKEDGDRFQVWSLCCAAVA